MFNMVKNTRFLKLVAINGCINNHLIYIGYNVTTIWDDFVLYTYVALLLFTNP